MERRHELIHARERAGYTQQALAERLGITRLAVLNIEVGRRDPGHALMLKWTEALGPYGTLELWRPSDRKPAA
jgi:DNA-binding XRE family transcriptional regulator